MMGLPSTLNDAAAARGDVYRAGGTDLTETRRYGANRGDIVDLSGIAGLRGIEWDADGGARIGAMVTMAALLSDVRVRAAYPGLVQATANIAAPHIRAIGTVGGNLLQSTRCWYFRSHAFQCFKKGGDNCPSRDGNNLLGVCFDLGPCVAPHPSTLGMALLAHDAEVEVFHAGGDGIGGGSVASEGAGKALGGVGEARGGAVEDSGRAGEDRSRGVDVEALGADVATAARSMAIADLYGDGSDPSRDHLLPDGAILTAVRLPPPLADERSSYVRSNARAVAEWPLVEVLVRLSADGSFARVALGGVANIPLRIGSLERVLIEAPGDVERLERAVDAVIEAATPMPLARFKLRVLRGALLDALHGAMGYR